MALKKTNILGNNTITGLHDLLNLKVSIILLYVFLACFLLSRFHSPISLKIGGFNYNFFFFLLSFLFFLVILTFCLFSGKIKLSGIELPIYLLLTWSLLCTIIGILEGGYRPGQVSFSDGIGALFYIFMPMFLPLIIFNLRFNRNQLFSLLKGLVIISVIAAIINITSVLFDQWYITTFGFDRDSITRAVVLPMRNEFFLLLTLPLAVAFAQVSRQKKMFILYSIFSILTTLGILFAASRSRFLAVLISFGIGYLLLNLKNINFKRLIKGIIAVSVLLCFLNVMAEDTVRSFSRLVSLDYDYLVEDHNVQARIENYHIALQLFSDNPIKGTGVATVYPSKRADDPGEFTGGRLLINGQRALRDPHNLYLRVLSEIGIVGFSLFCYLLAKVVIPIRKSIRDDKGNIDYISLAFLVGIIAFLITMLTGTRLWQGDIRMDSLFWLYTGLGLYYVRFFSKS